MQYEASLYFNFPAFRDVIFLVINNEKVPDEIKKNGDFVGLYNGGELIGVNIFNSNTYLKMRIDGLCHNPNAPLIALVSSLVKSYLDEDVILIQSPLYVALVTDQLSNNTFKLDLGDSRIVEATNQNEDIKVGDYVLVSYKTSRLENGHITKEFLSQGTDYLVVGVEDNQLNQDILGSRTYILKEKK